jgi:predicted nucleic acid-binding protein
VDRKFLDVNAIAILVDAGHVGHSHVQGAVLPGFRGEFQILWSASLLMRARWVLVSQWGVAERDADGALESLARVHGPEYVGGDAGTIRRALELAASTRHDVYDCFIVALAEAGEATHLVTTDASLSRICEAVGLTYENPIPPKVLRGFGVKGRDS